MRLSDTTRGDVPVRHQANNDSPSQRPVKARLLRKQPPARSVNSPMRGDEKIQLINGTWHFFYGTHMLELKCGPRLRPAVVSREQAARERADLIEDFRDECKARAGIEVTRGFSTSSL